MATDEISGRDYNRNPRNHKTKSIWPFKGLDDPEYIKERDEVFEKNGHGWAVRGRVTLENIPPYWAKRTRE